MFIRQFWRKVLHSGTIGNIQSARKGSNNSPAPTTYLIFPRILESASLSCPVGTNFKALNLQRDRFNHFDPSTLSKHLTQGSPPAPLMSFLQGFMESSTSLFHPCKPHTCPFYSQDLLFSLGYANQQIHSLFTSFHSFFSGLVLSPSSILFVSLPSSASDREMTLAQFPPFLFLCLSSCYSLCVVSKCTLFSSSTWQWSSWPFWWAVEFQPIGAQREKRKEIIDSIVCIFIK